MANIWQFRGPESVELTADILQAAEGAPLLAKLLLNRGISTPEEIQEFLDLESYEPTSGWELPDMKVAVERILKALETQEHILIYGDFDVDGITGTSILYETLKYLGANVSYYIPDRATEGHGLNTAAVIRLTSTRKVKLVITTDTGITNFNEVSLLNGLKVDTIVTDHHELPENLPPAIANVNPKRFPDQSHPLAPLCGAGVAYKLCELLLETKKGEAGLLFANQLLDLTAIGTVADLASLLKENRYLVYQGLKILNTRGRLGIQKILEQAGTNPEAVLTSETVGFTIGPRLNAIGRLDNAKDAVELLTTKDPERAQVIASRLEYLNRQRRELCDQTFLEAERHLSATGGLGSRRAIILASPHWNLGIIGIVASRLIEKYHVPVFMMVVDESKGEARCSARSIPGFHLHDELLALQQYFLHFGGHAGAGGFSIKMEQLERFKQELYALTERKITEEQMKPIIEVEAKLEWSQLNPHLVELIAKMAPFGMDNPAPKFVLENVTISAQRGIGEGERHLKLMLTCKGGTAPIEGLIWNAKERLNPKYPHNFVVVPELNTFNNTTKVQLMIEDYQSPENRDLPVTSATKVASVVATAPVKVATVPAVAEEDPGIRWVDHRSRESVESFIGQLMRPLQEQRKLVIYHEGRKPEIPFLKEELLCGRLDLRQADELILWDLPPSLESLQQVLQGVQPEVIHLVGGKYQTVPVFPTGQMFLKVILQGIKRQMAEEKANVVEVEFATFAGKLAGTEPVVTNGLILLGKLGLIHAGVVEGSKESSEAPWSAIRVTLNPQPPAIENITQYLEFMAFQNALREVGKFRNWLLSAPLDRIKTTVLFNRHEKEANPHVYHAAAR